MIRKPHVWESQTTTLRPGERLTKMYPDWHVRRGKDGELKAYLCEDKRGVHLLLSSKLSLLAEHISRIACDEGDCVSVAALYKTLSNNGLGVNRAYAKHRWRVRPVSVEDAPDEFEGKREGFEMATVLASKASVRTACV